MKIRSTSIAFLILICLPFISGSFFIELESNNEESNQKEMKVDSLSDSISIAHQKFSEIAVWYDNYLDEQVYHEVKQWLSFCKKYVLDSLLLKGQIYLASSCISMGKFDEALDVLSDQRDYLNENEREEGLYYVDNYRFTAQVYSDLGYYEKARTYFSTALDYYEEYEVDKPNIKLNILVGIGENFAWEGKNVKALEHFQNCLRIIDLTPHEYDLRQKLGVYNGMANSHQKLGNLEKSIHYYNYAITEAEESKENLSFVIPVYYNNLGNSLRINKQYEKAVEALIKAANLYRNLYGEGGYREASTYSNIAATYSDQSDFEKAENYFLRSLSMLEGIFGKIHPDIARVYYNLGLMSIRQGDYESALALNDEALSALDFSENQMERVTTYASWETSNALWRKIDYYFEWYRATQKVNHLISANNTAEVFGEYLEVLRNKNLDQGSKFEFLNSNFPFFELYIEILSKLYEETGQNNYLQKAFLQSERNKGLLLMQTLREAQARKFAGIPDSLIEKDAQQKKQISDLEDKYYNLTYEKDLEDSTELKELQIELFETKEGYYTFLDNLEKSFPRYYNLKYNTSIPAISDIQNLLGEDQNLVEYFLGDSILYAFVIKPDDFQMVELNRDGLEKQIGLLRESIYEFEAAREESDSAFQEINQQYVEAAHQLYQHLITPLGELTQNLVIIPDGILNYLPFEVLLSELPDNPSFFSSHSYLIKKHQISYCYSAALLQEVIDKKSSKASKPILGLAPEFRGDEKLVFTDVDSRRRSLGRLDHNIPEAESIVKALKGKALTAVNATESSFLKEASKYRILHLATHAKSNDEDGEFSFLAFQEIPDSMENEKLFVREIYNLDLNAELVVLSACETGIGELRRGEGVLSLARGFFYAGAKSLITSLWSVDDRSTRIIMEQFYKNLKSGQLKDEALRNAKLKYLEGGHQNTHPFYWAAFTPVGDMKKMNLGSSVPLWLIAAGILIAGFLFLRSTKGRKIT